MHVAQNIMCVYIYVSFSGPLGSNIQAVSWKKIAETENLNTYIYTVIIPDHSF